MKLKKKTKNAIGNETFFRVRNMGRKLMKKRQFDFQFNKGTTAFSRNSPFPKTMSLENYTQ